jgi:Na+/H+-dicarboxylate symporter
MAEIVHHYGKIFITIALAQFGYILLIYFAASGFVFSKWLRSIRNMLAAAISGFSTMSSAASMPLTILGTERNTKTMT